MKKFILIALILFAGCGKEPGPVGPPGPPGPGPGPEPKPTPTPTPVPPPPIIVFEIAGKKILVKAEMKPNPKVSLEEMRAALRATVVQLEEEARLANLFK